MAGYFWWHRYLSRLISLLIPDKIVSVIRSCLEEWRKKGDTRRKASGLGPNDRSNTGRSTALESDVDVESSPDQISPVPGRSVYRGDSIVARPIPASSAAPASEFFTSRPQGLPREQAGRTFVPIASPEPFISSLSDFYLSPGLSFAHTANPVTMLPNGVNDTSPMAVVFNQDVSTAGHRLPMNGLRSNNIAVLGHQDDDDQELDYGYSSNGERTHRMFGINQPPWPRS
jgi:hypothetical protein